MLPTYMTSMTNNYNPDQKRGGPANAGNWTKYENSDPEGLLPGAPEPQPDRAPPRSQYQIDSALSTARANREAAEREEFELEKEALAATILRRFPTATEAEISNQLADDGEIQYGVDVIRNGTERLWDSRSDKALRVDGFSPFEDEMLEHSTGLDRYGMGELYQEADDPGRFFIGIKF